MQNLGLPERHVSLPMGVVAVGVGLGTLLAGYLSGKTIEVGLLPIGAVGVVISSIVLSFTSHSLAGTFLAVAFLGGFAGLFIIPAHSLLQHESPQKDKGGIWALLNVLQTLGMLIAALVFSILHGVFALKPPQIFMVCGWGTLLLVCVLLLYLPEALGRMVVWLKVRFSHGSRISGQDNIPIHGPILFILNGPPRSQFCLLLSGTRRFVRFVIPEASLRDPLLAYWTRNLGAICFPEAPGDSSVRSALAEAESVLARGEAVALFAGEDPSRPDGVNLPSTAVAGFLEKTNAVVLPVFIKKIRRGFRLKFKSSWNRKTPASKLLARLSGGKSSRLPLPAGP
jgi:acyl-[acyl-carrier-protein]-phospholipid O-acyltransferase/long-chain-fatty-acid--[acyl-carrier-protein] ligase